MTQKTLFHYTNGFTGATGDGSAPYTETEFRDYNRAILAGNEADAGVISGVDNELAVSGVASPLAVDTGRAQVYGFHYFNDASVNVAVTTPAIGDTGGRIVVRNNLTNANTPPNEDQGRVRVILNTDGNAAIPSMVQTPDVTWDIPLATFVIDTSGDIWTDASKTVAGVTDARVFAISPLAGMVRLREFVGDGSTGTCTFDNIQQNLTHLLVMGLVRSDNASDTDGLILTINGDTGFTYAGSRIAAVNGAVTTLQYASGTEISAGAATGTTGAADAGDYLEIKVPHYTSALEKSVSIRNNTRGDGTNGANGVRSETNEGWWMDTNSITRLDIALLNGNFETGSVITLYGMR